MTITITEALAYSVLPIFVTGLLQLLLFFLNKAKEKPKADAETLKLSSEAIRNLQESYLELSSTLEEFKKAHVQEVEQLQNQIKKLESDLAMEQEKIESLKTDLVMEQNARRKEAKRRKDLEAGVTILIQQMKELGAEPAWSPEPEK